MHVFLIINCTNKSEVCSRRCAFSSKLACSNMERGNKNRGAHRSLGTPLVVVFYAYNAMEILYDALRHHIKRPWLRFAPPSCLFIRCLAPSCKRPWLRFAPPSCLFIRCLAPSCKRPWLRFAPPSCLLYDALRHHSFSHLHEAGNVGAFHVVYVAVGLGAVLHAVLVNVFHDGVEACVYFFGGP